jgi:hypothetical protein
MWTAVFMVAAIGQIEYPALPGFAPLRPAAVVEDNPFAEPPAVVEAVRVPDAADAAAWALQDVLLRPPADRLYLRYLWIPPNGSALDHQVNSFLVNSAVSQTSTIALPDGAAGGWLIVWDLRQLAPRDRDLVRLQVLWDALGHADPYFHVELPGGKFLPCRSYLHLDGKTYNGRRHIPAPHVSPAYGLLEQHTGSFAPLLRSDQFLRIVSSTIDGGLYYHFAGFIRDGKRLSEAEIFRSVGLDVLLSRQVEGDDRAAMFQSGITGKPRKVEQVQGAIGKARITYDLFDEDVDANRHPIYELLDFVNRARGKEIIFERSNGLHGYLLTDGAGKLVDVAPPNLASDHRIPEPATKQLQPMISCVRCHGPDGGIRNVRNDVATLLGDGRRGDVDLFDDLSSKDGRTGTVNRIAGLFAAGDKFKSDLDFARNRYADAVFAATRGMSVEGKEQVAAKAAEQLAATYADYWLPRGPREAAVNADRAALELGYRVPEGQGAAFLRQAIRPGRVDVLIDGKPVEFADPALAALRRGMSVRRQDWERIAVYAALQIQEYRKSHK